MRKYFYVLVTVLLLVCLPLCGACGKSIEKQISEQLKLGQRYLMEENYEEAAWIYRCAESACPVFWKSPVRKEEITVPDR